MTNVDFPINNGDFPSFFSMFTRPGKHHKLGYPNSMLSMVQPLQPMGFRTLSWELHLRVELDQGLDTHLLKLLSAGTWFGILQRVLERMDGIQFWQHGCLTVYL